MENKTVNYKKKAFYGDTIWKFVCIDLSLSPKGMQTINSNYLMSLICAKYNIKHPCRPLHELSVHGIGTVFEAFIYDVYKRFGIDYVRQIAEAVKKEYNLC